jgi:hypothetical protein
MSRRHTAVSKGRPGEVNLRYALLRPLTCLGLGQRQTTHACVNPLSCFSNTNAASVSAASRAGAC